MEKHKNISQKKMIANYIDFTLENNSSPKSVYLFAKTYKFNEANFYTYFGSFKAIEKLIFKEFFNNTKEALDKSGDYPSFDNINKLLSFYFTFFENLSANRSYVLLILNSSKDPLKKLQALTDLKNCFTNYISELNIETIDFKEKKD